MLPTHQRFLDFCTDKASKLEQEKVIDEYLGNCYPPGLKSNISFTEKKKTLSEKTNPSDSIIIAIFDAVSCVVIDELAISFNSKTANWALWFTLQFGTHALKTTFETENNTWLDVIIQVVLLGVLRFTLNLIIEKTPTSFRPYLSLGLSLFSLLSSTKDPNNIAAGVVASGCTKIAIDKLKTIVST